MVNRGAAWIKRAAIAIAVVLVALACLAACYVGDYYHADSTALAAIADDDGDADGVSVEVLSRKAIAFMPANPTAGFIFYPGAKVQPEAYAPLMELCAERDIVCVIVKPLFNLAILDVNAADGIQAQFPSVDTWMIGGHSMGGIAASNYASRHEEEFEGVVFLASYPSADLSSSTSTTLSIVGTNDQVINWENYEKAKDKLPDTAEQDEISGGNHAFFGNYGNQAGDGTATIMREDQQTQAADAIFKLSNSLQE